MNIKRLMCNPLQENCYVVSDDTRECVIIDCGAYYDEEKQALASYIAQNDLKPVHLIATHGHLDHNFGNAYIYRTYGLQVEICAEDQQLLEQRCHQQQHQRRRHTWRLHWGGERRQQCGHRQLSFRRQLHRFQYKLLGWFRGVEPGCHHYQEQRVPA